MKGRLSVWQMVNEPPLRDRSGGHGVSQPLGRLFTDYYLAPHWPCLLIVAALASLAGLMGFGYAWAGKVIADEVVQVQMQGATLSQSHDEMDESLARAGEWGPADASLHGPAVSQPPVAEDLDPTRPGETRLFAFEPWRAPAALDDQLDVKVGRTVDQKLRLLALIAVLLLGMEIARHSMHFVRAGRMIFVSQKVQFCLRQRLHAKMLLLPCSYHDRHSPGQLLTCLFSDLRVIQNLMGQLVQMVPQKVLSLMVGAVIILVIDRFLGMLVLLALPAYSVIYRWFRERLKTINRNLREREGLLNAHIANRVSHFLTVKSFNRESREAIDFIRQAKPILRNHLAASVLRTGFAVLCGIVTGACMTAVLWIGTLRVRDGQMTLGELLMFYTAAGYLFTPAASLAGLAGQLHRLSTVAGRVMRVLDEPITLADPKDPVAVPQKKYEVRFEHVTMQYAHDRAPALDDVSFRLPAGKRLCVMGPSGAGKSTLAKLALRLYDPSDGRVMYDHTDLRQFQLADLRQSVGFVAQEPVVFSGTIGDNIRFGSEDASDDAVVEAARFAQIHDFIQQLPRCYSTLTYERGLTLSGGQKQRVNLARALLYDPKFLVLDDCTSALDAHTEAQLIESFQTVLRGRTVLLVSHRASIALECDLVMMLDGGRVVQFGPPVELLREPGPFEALYRHQIRPAQSA